MSKRQVLLLLLLLLTGLLSCNKTRYYSNCMDNEAWQLQELSVDGLSSSAMPIWNLSTCNPYGEFCSGTWTNADGGTSNFYWQLRESAGVFELSNRSDLSSDYATNRAVMQCSSFSGVYVVAKRNKNEMEFHSNALSAFPGKQVVIRIKKIS